MRAIILIMIISLFSVHDTSFALDILGGCSLKEERSRTNRPEKSLLRVIDIQKPRQLTPMSRDDIIRYRTNLVKKYAVPGIYPRDYDPFKGAGSGIYGSMDDGVSWTESASFFLSNPYMLVVLTYAGYSTPVDYAAQGVRIEFAGSVVSEKHTAEASRRWFRKLGKYEGSSGIIRLNTVNALDAGFEYCYADIAHSLNIGSAHATGGNNITSGPYACRGFYHKGRSGFNNLSPADPGARIKILRDDTFTRIFVKLWRKKPFDISSEADITCMIIIDPSAGDNK